jgi:hypothetical protein
MLIPHSDLFRKRFGVALAMTFSWTPWFLAQALFLSALTTVPLGFEQLRRYAESIRGVYVKLLGYLAAKENYRSRQFDKYDFVLLLMIWGASLALRIVGLGSLYLWFDENIIIGNLLRANTIEYSDILTRVPSETTYNSLTGIVPLFMAKHFGGSLFAARFPGAVIGSLVAPSVFSLTRISGAGKTGAIIAALFAAASITQIENSQRLFPIGVSSGLSAILIVCSLLMICDMVSDRQSSTGRKWGIMALFAVVSIIGVCYHFSILLVALPNAGLLIFFSLKYLKRPAAMTPILLGVIPVFLGAVFAALFSLNEAERFYLAQYYCPSPLDISALSFFGNRIYLMLLEWTDFRAFHMRHWPEFVETGLLLAKSGLPSVFEQPSLASSFISFLAHIPFALGLIGLLRSACPRRLEKILLIAIFLTILGTLCLASVRKAYPLGPVRHCLPAAVFWYVLVGWGWDYIANTKKALTWFMAFLLSGLGLFWACTLASGFYMRKDALEIANPSSFVHPDLAQVVLIDPWSFKDIDYYFQKGTEGAAPLWSLDRVIPLLQRESLGLAIADNFYSEGYERGFLIFGELYFILSKEPLLAELESHGYKVRQVLRNEPENLYVYTDMLNGLDTYYFCRKTED